VKTDTQAGSGRNIDQQAIGHVCRVSHMSDPPRCLDCGSEWPQAEPQMLPEEHKRPSLPPCVKANAGTEARRVAVASGALLADESKGE
jgi:hypothetical protein